MKDTELPTIGSLYHEGIVIFARLINGICRDELIITQKMTFHRDIRYSVYLNGIYQKDYLLLGDLANQYMI